MKYDGFSTLLVLRFVKCRLISRNVDLNDAFIRTLIDNTTGDFFHPQNIRQDEHKVPEAQ